MISQESVPHLVYADFVFSGGEPPAPESVDIFISGLLPNPQGEDRGQEVVELTNRTSTRIDLQGWHLRDRAGNLFDLSGSVEANKSMRIESNVSRRK